mgnify:CR=1 FL=1
MMVELGKCNSGVESGPRVQVHPRNFMSETRVFTLESITGLG